MLLKMFLVKCTAALGAGVFFLSEACIIYQNVLHENSWISCLSLHN